MLMLGLWMVLSAGTARAQAVKGSIWSVGIGGMDGKDGVYREGSWVPIVVKLQNLMPAPFVGHLAVEQIDLDGDKVMTVGPEFVLPPGVDQRTLWTYYWPRPDFATAEGGVISVLVLDKNKQVVTSVATPLVRGLPQSGARGIMPEDDLVRRSTRFVLVLGKDLAGWKSFEGMYGGTEAVKPVLLNQPNAMPDNVLGLDGVDVIVWDADAIKVSDLAPEFQLQALLEWVKSGGHLIISVGTQGQEFLKAGSKMMEAMPLTITGTRDIKVSDVGTYKPWELALTGDDKPLTQVVGEFRPDSRTIIGGSWDARSEVFREHPMIVTGVYGQGAITVVTFDVSSPELKFHMGERDWISFWTRAAGWRQRVPESTGFFTAAQVDQHRRAAAQKPPLPGFNQIIEDMSINPHQIRLGQNIPQDVDVKDVTAVRILVALAFLALYWLLAGPIGHLVLRQYKVVHWSWWIFGAVVVAATAIAGSVVLVLHVKAYDVRHHTFVLGTVNGKSATAVSFYGIYAPVSGPVDIRQGDGGPGLNYVVPMCVPTFDAVKSYADPQSYAMSAETPWQVQPVFRNTLKKMQGRWTGVLPGISGGAEFVSGSSDPQTMLTGRLTNNSGYDLQNVQIIVNLPPATGALDQTSRSLRYIVGPEWRNGQSLDLQSGAKLDTYTAPGGLIPQPVTTETYLEVMAWKFWKETKGMPYGRHYGAMRTAREKSAEEKALDQRSSWEHERDDLLFLLADARNLEPLEDDERYELVRGVGRMTDLTKALHAAGGLIVAAARDVGTPVPLTVNGKPVQGRGDVIFGWVLPVAGQPPKDLRIQPANRSILPVQPERP